MRCNDIDFITRNGHSDVFKNDVKRVFDSINLGIDGTPKLVFYYAISVSNFRSDNLWCRIPCENRMVYCKKINDFWKDKYEIAYKTKLSIYGDEHERSFYRVLRIEYDDSAYINLCRNALREHDVLRGEVNRLRRELLNTERSIHL